MLTIIAATSAAVKLLLLLVLVRDHGLIGAAIATAAATVIAQQGQALVGAARFEYHLLGSMLLPIVAVSAVLAVGGRMLFVALAGSFSELAATTMAGSLVLAGLAIAIALLLDPSERAALRRRLRLRPPREA